MAQNNRVPKQWRLTKEETLTSFEDWKSNLIYSLRQDQYFVPFLRQNIEWRKRKHEPNFGLRALNGRSQEQRVADLENLLDNIANFCPVIKRKTITHERVKDFGVKTMCVSALKSDQNFNNVDLMKIA